MPMTEEMQRAAQALGQALQQTPAVQRYQAAAAYAAQQDDLSRMEADLAAQYAALSAREQAGQVLTREEINNYHNLREKLRRHPAWAAREAALQEVRFTFGRASQALSSTLTVDFNALATEK